MIQRIPKLKLGDLVLFSGRGFVSNGIRIAQWLRRAKFARFTHIGVIYQPGTCPLMAEVSHANDVRDELTGSFYSGINVRDLYTRMSRFKGSMWVAPLVHAFDEEEAARFHEMILAMHSRKARFSTMKMVRSGIPWLDAFDIPYDHDLLQKTFCAEAVCSWYRVARSRMFASSHCCRTSPSDFAHADYFGAKMRIK